MGILKKLFGQGKTAADARPAVPEFRFELVLVRGIEALDELERLEQDGVQDGFRPVLVGDQEELDYLTEQFELAGQSFENILAASESITPSRFFEQRVEQDPEYYTVAPGEPVSIGTDKDRLIAHLNPLTNEPVSWVFIAKIPDRETCHIPAHFAYGGWNECPLPEEHVALWKYWNEKYGAEIVSVTHDIIEAKVARPPATLEQAMALAREHFIYCGDVVHQGAQTLENLAALLQDGRTWYFWWD